MKSHPLDRRRFLLGTAAAAGLSAQTTTKTGAPAADPHRRIYELNRRWLFGGKAMAGFAAPEFDDSKWDRITLPHSNVRLPWHSFDEKEFQFVSAYRRHFRAPAGWNGKRIFVDFGGAMTAATVTVNGHQFEEYNGGYTPFSFELTPHLKYGADNVLAVEVDSTERPDIPPFGDNIDYLTFGGIYRDVELRVVPKIFIENVFAKPVRPLEDARSVVVRCYLNGNAEGSITLTAELRDGDRVVKFAGTTIQGGADFHDLSLDSLGPIDLWDLQNPKLYDVVVKLSAGNGVSDEHRARIGFREAHFTPQGFCLNGEAHQAARPEPPPDVSLRRRRHAGARAAARRMDSAARTALQHRAHVALSAIAGLSGRLRRARPAGAGRDSGLAAHRRQGVAGSRGATTWAT